MPFTELQVTGQKGAPTIRLEMGLTLASAVDNVSSLKHAEKPPFGGEWRVGKGYPGKRDHTVFTPEGFFVLGNMTNTEAIQRPIQQVVFFLPTR